MGDSCYGLKYAFGQVTGKSPMEFSQTK